MDWLTSLNSVIGVQNSYSRSTIFPEPIRLLDTRYLSQVPLPESLLDCVSASSAFYGEQTPRRLRVPLIRCIVVVRCLGFSLL
jgi:hypothetical protein